MTEDDGVDDLAVCEISIERDFSRTKDRVVALNGSLAR